MASYYVIVFSDMNTNSPISVGAYQERNILSPFLSTFVVNGEPISRECAEALVKSLSENAQLITAFSDISNKLVVPSNP